MLSALVKRHTFLKSFAILSVYRWAPLCPNRSPNLSECVSFYRTSLTESKADDTQSMLQLFPYIRIGG